jgi:hypothetical protein
MRRAAAALLLACGCARPAPAPEPAAPTATITAPSAAPAPEVAPTVETEAEPAVEIPDFAAWSGTNALCHPDERWDTKRGCLPTSSAKAIRCGSERDARTSCSCRADDLLCMMSRCGATQPRRRIPNWDQAAPPVEHEDCQKQCDNGHAPSCLRLGITFVRAKNRRTRGVALIEQSCKLGYGPGCSELFHLYRWLPESRSRPYAAHLQEALCKQGPDNFIPCSEAAEAYRNGWGVKQNTDTAADYRELACEIVKKNCKGNESCVDEARMCL